jgi:hypothetical protein
MEVRLTFTWLPMTYPEASVVACQRHTSAYRVGDVVQELGQGVNWLERGYTDVGQTCPEGDRVRAWT